jgi:hypothetical protein
MENHQLVELAALASRFTAMAEHIEMTLAGPDYIPEPLRQRYLSILARAREYRASAAVLGARDADVATRERLEAEERAAMAASEAAASEPYAEAIVGSSD